MLIQSKAEVSLVDASQRRLLCQYCTAVLFGYYECASLRVVWIVLYVPCSNVVIHLGFFGCFQVLVLNRPQG